MAAAESTRHVHQWEARELPAPGFPAGRFCGVALVTTVEFRFRQSIPHTHTALCAPVCHTWLVTMPDLWPIEDDPQDDDDVDDVGLLLSADEEAEFYRHALEDESSDEEGDANASRSDEASAKKRLQKTGAPASATTIKKYKAYWMEYVV